MTQKGDWLDIGGATSSGYGAGSIEVRVCTGVVSWEWKTLDEEQIKKLLKLANMVKHTTTGELI